MFIFIYTALRKENKYKTRQRVRNTHTGDTIKST